MQLVLPFYEETAGQAARAAIAQLGVAVDWGGVNAAVLDLARREAARYARAATDTSQAQVQQLIARWVERGGTLKELIRQVRAVWSGPRADVAAATEVTRLYAQGNRAAWARSGAVDGLTWKTAADDRVCPICGPKAGTLRPVDSDDLPPAHPGCRCWIVPKVRPADAPLAEGAIAPLAPARQPKARAEVLAAVRDIENAIQTLPIEMAMAVDEFGELALSKGGARSVVFFTDEETDMLRGRRVIFTHNHPGGWDFAETDPRRQGNSFSPEDISYACEIEAVEMRVVTPRWRFSMRAPPEGWNSAYYDQTIAPVLEIHFRNVRTEFWEAINSGRMTPDEAEALHWHTVWTRVAAALGLRYEREEF